MTSDGKACQGENFELQVLKDGGSRARMVIVQVEGGDIQGLIAQALTALDMPFPNAEGDDDE